ncbi:MAG: hypothetical protein QM765_44740 [Myxococcales bacterium]
MSTYEPEELSCFQRETTVPAGVAASSSRTEPRRCAVRSRVSVCEYSCVTLPHASLKRAKTVRTPSLPPASLQPSFPFAGRSRKPVPSSPAALPTSTSVAALTWKERVTSSERARVAPPSTAMAGVPTCGPAVFTLIVASPGAAEVFPAASRRATWTFFVPSEPRSTWY